MNKKIFLGLIIFSFTVFLIHYFIVGNIIWGDGQYYYSYLRSTIIDGDLNFANELAYFRRPIILTNTGLVANKYSIGPSLFWSPFFALAHIITLVFHTFIPGIQPDGYSTLYQIFTGLGSVFYAACGLFLCCLIVGKFYQKKVACLSVIGIFFSSSLFFYSAVDPVNSHPLSFFLSSLLLFLLVNIKKFNNSLLIWLGFVCGLLTVLRNQDIILALPVIILLKKVPQKIFWGLVTIIVMLPQVAVWKYLYGALQNPYILGGESFNFYNPQIWSVLFNLDNGLFIFAPILMLGCAGFYWLYRKYASLTIIAVVLITLQLYLISSWHDWAGGQSYGGRFFISLLPYFMLGFAGFINRFKDHYRIIVSATLVLAVINWISITRFLITHP